MLSRGGIGGIGAHSSTLAHAIADLGHEVSVVAEASGNDEGEQTDGLIRVHAISRGSPRQWKLGHWLPVSWLRWSLAVERVLRRVHAERTLDLVVFPDAYGEGFRFALSPFVPFVVRFGGPASVVQRWDGRAIPALRARIETWIERLPAARAPVLLCASSAFAQQMAREWSLDASRFRIIRNPLDLGRFRPAGGEVRRTSLRVLFVGHLQPLKGLHELVAAMPLIVSQHPSVDFQLVGNDTKTGPGRSSLRLALEEELRKLGMLERVSFIEPLPQPELVPLYQACSVFVLPSHNDVYPNAVLGAMGCARPCVVTRTAGAAELVTKSECGLVVPPKDPAALAAAISTILALPDAEREAMGLRGRRAVEEACATKVIAGQAIEAYREAIERFNLREAGHGGAP
jgi:glycosyltransferase involved in cell wall biosynthesis